MIFLYLSIQNWLAGIEQGLHSLAVKLDGPGLLLVAVADSSFLSIPEGNDLLIVILSAGKSWERMAYYVFMTVVGSVTGCMLLYTVGRKGGSPLLHRRFSAEHIERAEKLFNRFGILTVVVPSVLPPPTPFKIFVLSAGVFRLSPTAFLCAVVIGRTLRYSIWGILAVLYGNSVRLYMQRSLPQIGLALFVALVSAGVVFVVFHRCRSRRRAGSRNQ